MVRVRLESDLNMFSNRLGGFLRLGGYFLHLGKALGFYLPNDLQTFSSRI